MKHLILYIVLLSSVFVFSQNEQLAQYYFDKGDFEKAKISYKELLESVPQNQQYFLRTVDCYQQLQQFDIAEKEITNRLKQYKQANLLVELGYNYQLQKNEAKAKEYYNQAIDAIQLNAYEVYSVSQSFEKKVLLDYALKSYETAELKMANLNFNYQKGLLYGQLGDMEKMVDTFLDEAYAAPQNSIMIQNQMSRFMTDEGDTSFSDLLRKALVVRVQKSQDLFWNHYLSWYYVQQKEFSKAFIQEKSIYKRNPESLSNIINLAQLSIQEEDEETAKMVLDFVLENTQNLELLLQANSYLMKMKIDKALPAEYGTINAELDALLKQYEISPFSLSLQLIQAHFVAFKLKKPDDAKVIVKKALSLPLNNYQQA